VCAKVKHLNHGIVIFENNTPRFHIAWSRTANASRCHVTMSCDSLDAQLERYRTPANRKTRVLRGCLALGRTWLEQKGDITSRTSCALRSEP
jgi:hypothetical protein